MRVQYKKFYSVGVNFILAFMLITLTMIVSIEPIMSVSTNSPSKVYYSGNTNESNVTFMINVYWGNEYLDGILKEFNKRNLKTTFFVGGMWVAKYPELLQEIQANGNEIGNHGYFHKEQSKLSYAKNQDEILNTHNIVREYTGLDMNLFAPPSGDFSDVTVEVATNLGYKTIMWTRDTIDWRDKDADIIYSRAIKNLANGDLILMHPTFATLEALPRILDYCIEKGFNVTTVSENLGS